VGNHRKDELVDAETVRIIAPILGALVGGSLAIFGGLLVAKTTGRRDKRKLHLEKLEEIHEVATDILVWSERNTQMAAVAHVDWERTLKQVEVRPPTERLTMLTDMYEKSLRPLVGQYVEKVDGQQHALFEYYGAVVDFIGERGDRDDEGGEAGNGEEGEGLGSDGEENPNGSEGGGIGRIEGGENGDADGRRDAFEVLNQGHEVLEKSYRALEVGLVSAVHRIM
jgi:hypothetical protein